jgi:hypothetical protein
VLESSRQFPKTMVVSSSVYPKRSGSAIVTEKLTANFSPDELAVFGELSPLAKPIERPASRPRFYYFRSRLSLLGRGARFVSAIRWKLLPWITGRIVQAARKEKCQAILGVYPDELYLYAALLASQKLSLPFFSYFHNTFFDNVAIQTERAEKIQSLVFEQSKIVYVMSEGMRRHFEAAYKLPCCIPLVHSFESQPRPEPTDYVFPLERRIKVVLFGNFNESNIDATKRLCHALAKVSNAEVHVYSEVPKYLLAQRGIPVDAIHYHSSLGSLAFDDLIAELRKYDVVALTHGFTGGYGEIEYKTIFPTRTIPMLLSGRPMLIHSPRNAWLTEFCRESEVGAIASDPTEDAVLRAWSDLCSRLDQIPRYVHNALRAVLPYHGTAVANTLRSSLQSRLNNE